MRLRGLPRELNCGNVELMPAKDCPFATNFQTCASCEFTDVNYYRLDCSHIHCEGCLVFHDASPNEILVQCSVCNDARSATLEHTALTNLFLARFECPCGEEGNLHHLSRHRRSCRESQRRKAEDLNESHASSASSSSVASTSYSQPSTKRNLPESETELPKSFEFIVKGYIAQELNRLKEDVLNTTRDERHGSETAHERLRDRVDYLDTRLDHLGTLETRLESLERAGNSVATQLLQVRLNSLEYQVRQHLPDGDDSSSNSPIREAALQQFVRLQSKCAFLWFDVKTLLREYNRTRQPSATADQTMLIAGYPCKFHMQIDFEGGVKSLVLYVGNCDDVPYSANWPMRRNLTFRIYDNRGEHVFENQFSTTESSCRDYFKGPGSHNFGTYYGIDMCTLEELTAENFYQRCNGMICLGVTVSPCGGVQDE